MSQQLVDVIKMAAGTYRNDNVNYYVGIVMPQDDGTAYDEDNLTITVQIISSKSVTNMPSDNTYQNNLSVTTTQAQQNTAVDQMLSPLIMSNVQLMCGVDDGVLMVPVIGSQVVVMTSTYQNAFVVQYSNVDLISNSFNTRYECNVGLVGGPSFTDVTMSDTIAMKAYNADASAQSEIDITQTNISLAVTSGASAILDTKFDLLSKNGVEIKADTKISIKNTSADLNTILTNIKTALQDINSVVIPSGGGAIATLAPDLLVKITSITTDLTNLME